MLQERFVCGPAGVNHGVQKALSRTWAESRKGSTFVNSPCRYSTGFQASKSVLAFCVWAEFPMLPLGGSWD